MAAGGSAEGKAERNSQAVWMKVTLHLGHEDAFVSTNTLLGRNSASNRAAKLQNIAASEDLQSNPRRRGSAPGNQETAMAYTINFDILQEEKLYKRVTFSNIEIARSPARLLVSRRGQVNTKRFSINNKGTG